MFKAWCCLTAALERSEEEIRKGARSRFHSLAALAAPSPVARLPRPLPLPVSLSHASVSRFLGFLFFLSQTQTQTRTLPLSLWPFHPISQHSAGKSRAVAIVTRFFSFHILFTSSSPSLSTIHLHRQHHACSSHPHPHPPPRPLPDERRSRHTKVKIETRKSTPSPRHIRFVSSGHESSRIVLKALDICLVTVDSLLDSINS